jgi:hypothetical protein
MNMVQINGQNHSKASYLRARQIVNNKPEGSIVTKNDVLASIKNIMPGWNVSAVAAPFQGNGPFNIAIHPDVLQRAANDPEALVELKTRVLDTFKFAAPLPAGAEARGVVIGADGGGRGWIRGKSGNGETQRAVTDLPRNRPEDWTEILLKKLEDERRLERIREFRESFLESSHVDYLSQEDYKSALESMTGRQPSSRT